MLPSMTIRALEVRMCCLPARLDVPRSSALVCWQQEKISSLASSTFCVGGTQG
jgi:hypothetical protein